MTHIKFVQRQMSFYIAINYNKIKNIFKNEKNFFF